jgi:integrase
VQGKYRGKTDGRTVGTNNCKFPSSNSRREVERLMAVARKGSRWGHRDATMVLIGYRHGLRASELCDLQWSQVELTAELAPHRFKDFWR